MLCYVSAYHPAGEEQRLTVLSLRRCASPADDTIGELMVGDLVLWRVVDDLRLRLVVGDVEFEAVERPRYENDRASLVVERKVSDVQHAVDFDDRWEHPQHVTS